MDFATAARQIIETGSFLNAHGWAPATAGNYSMRLTDGTVAITVSGAHKGQLTPQDIMRVDSAGTSLDQRRPSAETLLHTSLYTMYPAVGAILHTHSIANTVLSRVIKSDALVIRDYELLKAFAGIDTHATSLTLPIVDNSQDIAALRIIVEQRLTSAPAPAYLIRGHGIYTWGADMTAARRAVEALEFLLECELWERRLTA